MKITTLVCALGALFLTACSSVGGLKLSSTENVEAKVTRQLFATDQVEIKFNDKVYRGDWNAVSASDEQKSKVSFEHRKHLHSVKTLLKAADGSEMNCLWIGHSYSADGKCSVGGREFSISVKRG
jgi:outer membrane biogenesis lipoprotein LolB